MTVLAAVLNGASLGAAAPGERLPNPRQWASQLRKSLLQQTFQSRSELVPRMEGGLAANLASSGKFVGKRRFG